MTNKVTEANYKAQIAALQSQLMQRHTVTAIDAVQPFCEAIGINPTDYVKATSAMSNQHKAFCDGILKTASSKVTRLQRDATVRILEAQTKRNKAITAASEAIEVVQYGRALMHQLFNAYGQKVRANIALNLHPFYLGKLERLASRIGSGIQSEEQRLILAIGEMLRNVET